MYSVVSAFIEYVYKVYVYSVFSVVYHVIVQLLLNQFFLFQVYFRKNLDKYEQIQSEDERTVQLENNILELKQQYNVLYTMLIEQKEINNSFKEYLMRS